MTKKHKNLGPLFIVLLVVAAYALYSFNKVDVSTTQENTTVSPSVSATPVVKESPVTPKTSPVVAKPSAPTASITLVNPIGGEKWDLNRSYSVTWNYSGLNMEDKISVALRSADESKVCWLGKAEAWRQRFDVIPSNCSTVNAPFQPGQYKLQIIVDKFTTGMGVADITDKPITIVQSF